MILGIGTETAAKDLSTALSSQYAQVSGNISSGSIAQSASGLSGGVVLQGGSVRVGPVGSDGSSSVAFTLKSTGLQGDSSVTVNRIDAKIGTGAASPIVFTPFTITVKKGAEQSEKVPVKFAAGLPAGPTRATLSFSFPSGQGFSPSDVDVSFAVKGWAENNAVPLGAGAALAVIVIVALVLLFRRMAVGGPLSFQVLIDDSPVNEALISLSSGHEVFLNEAEGSFSLIEKKNARSLARFFVKNKKLGMGVLKTDRFPKLAEVPEEVRGRTFTLKTDNGRKLDLEIRDKAEAGRPEEKTQPPATQAAPATAPAPRARRKKRPARKASVSRPRKKAT